LGTNDTLNWGRGESWSSGELEALLNDQATHHFILGDYQGPYSLSVTRRADGVGFLLRLPGNKYLQPPRSVTIGGRVIPLFVESEFEAPRPFSGRRM
jgi:hypothetical protein